MGSGHTVADGPPIETRGIFPVVVHAPTQEVVHKALKRIRRSRFDAFAVRKEMVQQQQHAAAVNLLVRRTPNTVGLQKKSQERHERFGLLAVDAVDDLKAARRYAGRTHF